MVNKFTLGLPVHFRTAHLVLKYWETDGAIPILEHDKNHALVIEIYELVKKIKPRDSTFFLRL